MSSRAFAVGLTIALAVGVSGSTVATPVAAATGPRSGWELVGDTGRKAPPHFVAFDEFAQERSGGFEGVGLDLSSDGSLVRRLLSSSHHHMALGKVALDPAGLLVSYSSGPACTSGVSGCGPKPDTCASEIDRYDVQAGTWTRLVKPGSNRLVGNAQLSPDGRYLAYSESPCVPSYFNDHLRVLDLTNWSSWTIGAGLPRCHFLSLQAWTLDSRRLLVDYAPARGSDYNGADGTCTEPRKQHLKLLNAFQEQAGAQGVSEPTHRGCQLQSAAPAGAGVIAVEACGNDRFLDGVVRLVRFNGHRHRTSRVALGRCTDGNDVAANRSGTRWLISAYLFCGGSAEPVTKVWAFNGKHLRHVATRKGGDLTYSSLTW